MHILQSFFNEKIYAASKRIPHSLSDNGALSYLTSLLVSQAKSDSMPLKEAQKVDEPNLSGAMDSLDNLRVDISFVGLSELQKYEDQARYEALKTLADGALFYAGYLRGSKKAIKRGLPYYCSLGEQAYGELSRAPIKLAFFHARNVKVYAELAAKFAQAADILHDVSLRIAIESGEALTAGLTFDRRYVEEALLSEEARCEADRSKVILISRAVHAKKTGSGN